VCQKCIPQQILLIYHKVQTDVTQNFAHWLPYYIVSSTAAINILELFYNWSHSRADCDTTGSIWSNLWMQPRDVKIVFSWKSIIVCLKSIFFPIIEYLDAMMSDDPLSSAVKLGMLGEERLLTDRRTGGGDAWSPVS